MLVDLFSCCGRAARSGQLENSDSGHVACLLAVLICDIAGCLSADRAYGSWHADPSRLPCAIHCYHGFGANTFSWSFVEQQLAEDCQAQVTSHDMPGFGLTQRYELIPYFVWEHLLQTLLWLHSNQPHCRQP